MAYGRKKFKRGSKYKKNRRRKGMKKPKNIFHSKIGRRYGG